jgi:hypothetical protein
VASDKSEEQVNVAVFGNLSSFKLGLLKSIVQYVNSVGNAAASRYSPTSVAIQKLKQLNSRAL